MRRFLALLLLLPVYAIASGSIGQGAAAELRSCSSAGPLGPFLVSIPGAAGKCIAKGLRTWDGGFYDGEVIDREMHGRGTLVSPRGERFVGEFQRGRRHGDGIEYRADGSVIRAGRWDNDRFVEPKIIEAATLPTPAVAPVTPLSVTPSVNPQVQPAVQSSLPSCPEWSGSRSGTGLRIYTDPSRSHCIAKGAETWNGGRYDGEVLNADMHGRGVLTLRDGTKYVGQFDLGKRHGEGAEYRADGSLIRAGRWENDRFIEPKAVQQASVPAAAPTVATSVSPQGGQTFSSVAQVRTEMDRLAAEAEAARKRQQELLERLNAEASERQRQTAEAEAERKRRRELEEQLARATEERKAQADTGQILPTPASPLATNRRIALIVGNSAYTASPLSNPVNDATDMASTLSSMGFEVILRTNVTRAQLRAAVREFGEVLRRKEVGLFYFAGHGVESKGRNFLIPVGANMASEFELEDEAVDANSVLRAMEDAGSPTSIMILDACRDNPFARSWRSGSRGLAQMTAPVGSFIAFATSPGAVAADGTGRNGTFTKHLLSSLRHADLDIDRVFTRVTAGVAQETGKRQVPWKSSSLTGAFSFR